MKIDKTTNKIDSNSNLIKVSSNTLMPLTSDQLGLIRNCNNGKIEAMLIISKKEFIITINIKNKIFLKPIFFKKKNNSFFIKFYIFFVKKLKSLKDDLPSELPTNLLSIFFSKYDIFLNAYFFFKNKFNFLKNSCFE